jgi:predicted regulator of Ras-like GTPase activity (Roadblock/LC7/MglB family)
VDAAQSLADLTEISSQVLAAAIMDREGEVVASTLADGVALAEAGRALLVQAARVGNGAEPTQVEVATEEGSVFLFRDGGRTIVATTGPRPTVGLVFYDLKSALRSVEDSAPKPKPKPKAKAKPRAPRKKKPADDA